MLSCGPLSCFLRPALTVVVVLLLCGPSGECCGPGRRGGRRRSPRRLTPLVFKEHVPNVAETTLGGSGLTEGHITKDDPRFQELVPNYNSDIYFRDEEGTGVDRIMTERCRERLNMLTISVMNTWSNVRLRVTDGWEQDDRHQQNSLHYEGRAVDISTSDRDRSKLGMLARLAIEAGFDWVYYESRSHIHCSVKSESSARRRLGGCFPTDAQVTTPSGRLSIGTLQVGDFVQVLRPDGSLGFSPVLLFIHNDPEETRSFLQLGTSSGKMLTLTPSHLVFVIRQERYFEGVTSSLLAHAEGALAGSVRPGDYLLTTGNSSVVLERVISFDAAWRSGVFAPLTRDGTIVVNSVVASCYAVIDSQSIAHWAFLPVRMYYSARDTARGLVSSLMTASDLNINNIIPSYSKQKHDSIDSINEIENTPAKQLRKEEIKRNKQSPDTKWRLYPNSIKNYRKMTNSSRKIYISEGSDPTMLSISRSASHQLHIHWYAKFLYEIAYWLLPKHLVYA